MGPYFYGRRSMEQINAPYFYGVSHRSMAQNFKKIGAILILYTRLIDKCCNIIYIFSIITLYIIIYYFLYIYIQYNYMAESVFVRT